jgi:hypothetical protein
MTPRSMNFFTKWYQWILLMVLNLCMSHEVCSQTYSTGTITLSNTVGLAMTAKIDVGTQVTLTLTGPAGRWFAVGFDAGSMAAGTDIVSVNSSATPLACDSYLTGYSAPTTDLQQDWTISSDGVSGGVRTIVASRLLDTNDPNDFVFPSTPTSISLIWARSGSSTYNYSYHGGSNRGVSVANFSLLQPPSAPTGAANQTFCTGATIAQLSANGTSIQWYSNPAGGMPLASNTLLVNANTYYATQTINGLESSDRLEVAVSLISIPQSPTSFNEPADFCYMSSGHQFSIGSVPNATSYVWTVPNGATGSSVDTNINLLFSPNFQSGTLTVMAQNACGQSAPLNLVLNQHLPATNNLNVTSCTPYLFEGQILSQSGIYIYQWATIWGCDSTVVLNLTIDPQINHHIIEVTCGSYSWNGQTFFSSGIYLDTLQASTGCDSIVTLDLTINPITSITLDSTVIGSFSWNGTVYTSSGIYSQYFTSEQGCDSTVTINLTLLLAELHEQKKDYGIYPNPVGDQNQLFIQDLNDKVFYKIRDVHGKLIQEGFSDGIIVMEDSMNCGIYYLEIEQRVFKVVLE